MSESNGQKLRRELGLVDSTMLMVGIIIGSGIFMTTGVIARDLPSPTLIMAAWAVGGLLTAAGALTLAELAAAMPEAGGQYIYLREAFGRLAGFLFAWLTLLVYQPGAIAAVSVGFAMFLGYFVPVLGTENVLASATVFGWSYILSAGHLVAAAAILLLTAVNVRGVRLGSNVQNALTALKILGMVAFVALGLLAPAHESQAAAASPAPMALITGFGIGLMAVLWAFDGWSNLSFSAGEIRDPGRNIPLALGIGTLVVTVMYLLMNATYLRVLPISELSGVTRVAEKAAQSFMGPLGVSLIAGVVAVSTLGAANGSILAGARVYYAAARDGLFFRSAARVHDRYGTPHVALWIQGIWSAVVALSGTFEQLFTFTVFAAVLTYLAATATIFPLRRSRPDLPRPYRVWGYPWLPAIYLVVLAALAINTVFERPVESLAGLTIFALGLPVYWAFARSSATRAGATPPTGGSGKEP